MNGNANERIKKSAKDARNGPEKTKWIWANVDSLQSRVSNNVFTVVKVWDDRKITAFCKVFALKRN